MQEVNAQMVLKLHQMSGEPVANCHYLLAQTKGDYQLALKILERILKQRKNGNEGLPAPELDASAATAGADAAPAETPKPEARLDVLESRMAQLEARFMQLADSLDLVNQRLGALLDKVSGNDGES